MSSSAAKPEAPLPGPPFVWSADGKPVSVHLSLNVVRELEAIVSRHPSDEHRREELGGLLLGRVREGASDHWLVAVERQEQLECEHARGASWILSKQDQARLRSKLQASTRRRDGLVVVGWYRTHTRPGLFLDQHDFELFQNYFSAPSMVALAIRPAEREQEATAGFFIWEEDDVQRASSYQAFPFDAARLAPVEEQPQPQSAPKVVPMRPVPVPKRAAKPKPVAPVSAPSELARPSRNAPGEPAPPRRITWKAAALWTPVIAGGLVGILWNPDPLRSPKNVRVADGRQASAPPARAVFSMPDEPEPLLISPIPEPEPPAPAQQTRARKKEPSPRKQFNVAEVRRPASRPQLASAPALPVALAMRTEGLPSLKLEASPFLATATVEPAKASGLRRAVGSIPGLGFLKKKKRPEDFVPARVVHQVRPPSPASLTEDVPVRVKLMVDEVGRVVSAEPVGRRVHTDITDLAVDAAKRWRFEPARSGDDPVPTEVVVQFRFGPGGSEL